MTEIEQLRARCAELEARLAELAKQKPVAYCDDAVISGKVGNAASKSAKEYWAKGGWSDNQTAKRLCHPLYTHAPDSAARIAELEAENAELRKDADRHRVDCRTCKNRGQIDGSSQETHCEHCVWQEHWRTDHYAAIDAEKGE